jgi:hypothetical protein
MPLQIFSIRGRFAEYRGDLFEAETSRPVPARLSGVSNRLHIRENSDVTLSHFRRISAY